MSRSRTHSFNDKAKSRASSSLRTTPDFLPLTGTEEGDRSFRLGLLIRRALFAPRSGSQIQQGLARKCGAFAFPAPKPA